jgi:hypothetical protein
LENEDEGSKCGRQSPAFNRRSSIVRPPLSRRPSFPPCRRCRGS